MAEKQWQFRLRHLLFFVAVCACICLIPAVERQVTKENYELARVVANQIGEEFKSSGRYPSGSVLTAADLEQVFGVEILQLQNELALYVDDSGLVTNRWGAVVRLALVRTYLVSGDQELGVRVKVDGIGGLGSFSYARSYLGKPGRWKSFGSTETSEPVVGRRGRSL